MSNTLYVALLFNTQYVSFLHDDDKDDHVGALHSAERKWGKGGKKRTIKPQKEHQIRIFDTFASEKQRGIQVLCVMFCFVMICFKLCKEGMKDK